MDTARLTQQQRRQLWMILRKHNAALARIIHRMNDVQWRHDDPLYLEMVLASRACSAPMKLLQDAPGGLGLPRMKDRDGKWGRE